MLTTQKFEDHVKSFFPEEEGFHSDIQRTPYRREFSFTSDRLKVKYVIQEPKSLLFPWRVDAQGRGIGVGKTLEQAIQDLSNKEDL